MTGGYVTRHQSDPLQEGQFSGAVPATSEAWQTRHSQPASRARAHGRFMACRSGASIEPSGTPVRASRRTTQENRRILNVSNVSVVVVHPSVTARGAAGASENGQLLSQMLKHIGSKCRG